MMAAAGLLACAAAAAHAQAPCAAAGPSGRSWAAPLDREVTLRASDVPLRDALDRVSAAARVRLSYASDLVPLDRRVCVQASRAPLGDVLAALLAGFRAEPRVVTGQVVLAPSARADTLTPMQARVNVLEGIVATGSPAGASRRSVTVALDAVSGRSLERRDARTIAQVLNAAAPGVWAWSASPSNLLAQYGSVRGASSFGATYPKVYVDGVEAANPLLVTEIDPEGVERVEVIRGPQGAALYGSDAISGVVNIVTRHPGAEGEGARVEVRSRGGVTASDYAPSPPPTHEQRVAVRTGSNLRSAGAALTVGGTGEVFPGADSRRVSAVADGRWVARSAIATATLRFTDRRAGSGENPLVSAIVTAPDSAGLTSAGQSLQRYTLGTTAVLTPDGPWTHTFLAGVDGYRLDHVEDAVNPFPLTTDPALRSAAGSGHRGSLRASSTLRLGRGDDAQGTLTLAAEHSALRQRTDAGVAADSALGGRLPTRLRSEITESWRHSTGILAQSSGAWRNTLFGSAGVRVERNDAFTVNTVAVLPMLGAAWVQGVAGAEVKLRAAYGRGIRPARNPVRAHIRHDGRGGIVNVLEPETQSGIELGAELYAGRGFSLQVTRFDQRASGLIQDVAVGVDTIARDGPAPPERRVRFALQNVGAIDNAGWEMQGALTRGPLTLSGTMALVDSRVRRIAAGYLGDLRPGDRVLAVPARTATLAAEWERGRWTAGLTAARAWDWINYDRLALARDFSEQTRIPREMLGAALRQYWREYDGSTDLRITATRQVGARLWITAAADNLLGGQLGEPDNATIRPGRSSMIGLQARF
jgi:iron complex outermembrane receptor protein